MAAQNRIRVQLAVWRGPCQNIPERDRAALRDLLRAGPVSWAGCGTRTRFKRFSRCRLERRGVGGINALHGAGRS